jgi:hypothetical protein
MYVTHPKGGRIMARPSNKGVSKLTVRNKAPGTISTGANTEVLLDGQPLKGVSFLKFEFKPAKVIKVVLEMYCEVEVETDVQFTSEMPKVPTVKIGDKVYTLTEYSTVGAVSV